MSISDLKVEQKIEPLREEDQSGVMISEGCRRHRVITLSLIPAMKFVAQFQPATHIVMYYKTGFTTTRCSPYVARQYTFKRNPI